MNVPELLSVLDHGLQMIEQITAILQDTSEGAVKPAEALDHLALLHQKILDDRAAANAALHARFDTSNQEPKP